MNIKILGFGCATCRTMFSDVEKVIERLKLDAHIEKVTDLEKILSYGVMSNPVLVIDEKIMMTGYHGAKKIEAVVKAAAETKQGEAAIH